MRDLGPHKCFPSSVALLHTGSSAGSVGSGSGNESNIVFKTPASFSPRQKAMRGLAVSQAESTILSHISRTAPVAGIGRSGAAVTVATPTNSSKKRCRAGRIGSHSEACAFSHVHKAALTCLQVDACSLLQSLNTPKSWDISVPLQLLKYCMSRSSAALALQLLRGAAMSGIDPQESEMYARMCTQCSACLARER
jgi:hypothetical protein